MKLFPAILVFLFSVGSLSAQKMTPQKIAVKIKSGKFSINNADVTKGWKLEPVQKAIAGNDRRRAGFNTTHSYDDIGIVLFEKNVDELPSGELSEIQFYVGPNDTNRVSPKGLFTGSIEIEHIRITKLISPDKLKNILKDYKETNSYMEHNFRLVYKGLYIYFLFNKEETQIIKFSIGPDKRKPDDQL